MDTNVFGTCLCVGWYVGGMCVCVFMTNPNGKVGRKGSDKNGLTYTYLTSVYYLANTLCV